MCILLCIRMLRYQLLRAGGARGVGVAPPRLAFVPQSAIIYTWRRDWLGAEINLEYSRFNIGKKIMAKTVTAPKAQKTTADLFLAIVDAQNADINIGSQSVQSAQSVAEKWDEACGTFNWTKIKFNKSAYSNGIDESSFKMLKKIRTEYRDGWNKVNSNFDQRWAYVCKKSAHYKKPTNKNGSGKTTEAKLEESLRAAHRHAVAMECAYTVEKLEELLEYHGIPMKDAGEDD